MVILLAALEKFHQQLYKNILKVRDNRYDLRGSSHRLKAVGGAYEKRKDLFMKFQQDREKLMVSMMVGTMTSYIALMFVKELINQKYLINFYIDSLVAVVALVLAFLQIKMQYKIYKERKISSKSLNITLLSILFALILNVLFPKGIDFSFLVLVIGMIVSNRLCSKEWPK